MYTVIGQRSYSSRQLEEHWLPDTEKNYNKMNAFEQVS